MSKEIPVDMRIIAATKRDLLREREIEAVARQDDGGAAGL